MGLDTCSGHIDNESMLCLSHKQVHSNDSVQRMMNGASRVSWVQKVDLIVCLRTLRIYGKGHEASTHKECSCKHYKHAWNTLGRHIATSGENSWLHQNFSAAVVTGEVARLDFHLLFFEQLVNVINCISQNCPIQKTLQTSNLHVLPSTEAVHGVTS